MDEAIDDHTADPPRRGVLAGIAVAAVLLVAALVWALGGVGATTIEVDVEPGTMARIEAGERIELLPRTLSVDVGDTLVVTNRDDAVHEVGPYTVGPGQTIRQTFTTPGTIEGVCTLHPDGEITIVVG